jgi:hypothetical protein
MRKLCPVSLLFGAPGWAAPLRFGPFTGPGSDADRQEFLAIDRMTGGGVPHLKFNAKPARGCVLQGQVELDLDALQRGAGGIWPAVLLVMALRDLDEQDVLLGFGAAKGYGRFHIQSTLVEVGPAAEDQLLGRLLNGPREASGDARAVVAGWIEAVRTAGTRFAESQPNLEVAL